MMYIPNEWIINKKNEDIVHEVLNRMNIDIFDADDTIIKDGLVQLKELGETVILDRIEDGSVIFGA